MPNSRLCLGELVLTGAPVVGTGALVVGAPVVGATVAGATVVSGDGLVLTAAVGNAGVGEAVIAGLPPHAARIGSAITSIMAAALIRMRANGIFTINLLVKRNISICSI